MCTVTFVPNSRTVLLTSSRDEQNARAAAALPDIVQYTSGRILYPADGRAGGTWIACHENGNAMVLLNGGFHKHELQPPYRKSRGLVFLEIFDHSTPSENFSRVSLDNIEPFTLVIWEQGLLTEARWDGKKKHVSQLDASIPHIWSSVTLYDAGVRSKRETWFANWLSHTPTPSQQDVLRFHHFGVDGDAANNLLMSRNGLLQTVSITSILLSENTSEMHYRDLLAGLTSVHEWPKSSAAILS